MRQPAKCLDATGKFRLKPAMRDRQSLFRGGSQAAQAALGKAGRRGIGCVLVILHRQPVKDNHPAIKVADKGQQQQWRAHKTDIGFVLRALRG